MESALRRFKRQVQQEGIIKDVKKHSFFLKPGERKRLRVNWLRSSNARRYDDNPLILTPNQRPATSRHLKTDSSLTKPGVVDGAPK